MIAVGEGSKTTLEKLYLISTNFSSIFPETGKSDALLSLMQFVSVQKAQLGTRHCAWRGETSF